MDQQSLLKKENRISGNASFILPTLRKLMMLYLVVWSVSPPLEVGLIFRLLALGCAAGWFVLTAITDYRYGAMQKLSLIFLLLVILVNLIENRFSLSQLMKPIALYMIVLAFVMNSYYEDKWEELRFLIPVFLTLLIIYNWITFNELLNNPDLARRIVRADDAMTGYMKKGVGGYTLLYSQVILFPVLLAWVMSAAKYSRIFALLGVAYIASYLLFVFKAGYTIAVVSTLAGAIILLFYKRKNIIPGLLIAAALIVLFVLVIGYVDPVRKFLLDLFNGTTVADKITDIYDSIHNPGTAHSISERREKYMVSVNIIFVRYPFIGSLWNANPGGHSAILDVFAKYGLFGGIVYVYLITFAPRRMKSQTDSVKVFAPANAMLVCLLIVTLLDSVPYEMVFPIMLIAPLFFSEIKRLRSGIPRVETKTVM